MTRTGRSPIHDLMAEDHVVTARAEETNYLKGRLKNMRKINTRIVKTVVFAVVFAAAAVVSVSAGAKDKPLNKAELKNLIANAETKAEHERIAQYFDAEAARYEA